MSFKFVVNDVSAEIAAAFSPKELATSNTMVGQIAIAATGAIRDAADTLKTRGRANIAAAGFSAKWQNAWRVQVFPEKGVSLEAAVWAFHKIPFAGIFETGGRIAPKKGLLWLPLPTAPRGRGTRGSPLSIPPRALENQGVKLHSIRRAGKAPLLAADVRLQRSQVGRRDRSLSLSKLRSGTKGKRGVVTSVPLYVGVSAVSLRKRFNIQGVTETVRGQLAEFYFANLRA